MGHLDDDVAAYVDGQLPESAALAARRHLQHCDECRWAVAQQEALKQRMRQAEGPALPPGLAASLSRLPDARIEHESRFARIGRSRLVRRGAVVVGASLALLAVAFTLGSPRSGDGAVSPPYEAYAAAFGAPSAQVPGLATATPIDDRQADRLTAEGWPCHHTLAGDLRREHAAQDASTVALRYSNGTHRLHLYEERGSLSHEAVRGFAPRVVAGAPVWVSAGTPTIVTWDADDVVYTVVTDAGPERVRATVAQLPTAAESDEPGAVERVGAGFARMAGWLGR